jgi:hypothetical protein
MGRILALFTALLALPGQPCGAGTEVGRGFAAVVHPSNPARDLRLRDLTSLFGGGNRQWPDSSLVVLVERDAASTPFQYLMEHVLNTTPGEYTRRLQNGEYRGGTPLSIKILNSDSAACEFVFNVPPAIAIVESKSLGEQACSAVRVLRIEGKLPDEEGYRLR